MPIQPAAIGAHQALRYDTLCEHLTGPSSSENRPEQKAHAKNLGQAALNGDLDALEILMNLTSRTDELGIFASDEVKKLYSGDGTPGHVLAAVREMSFNLTQMLQQANSSVRSKGVVPHHVSITTGYLGVQHALQYPGLRDVAETMSQQLVKNSLSLENFSRMAGEDAFALMQPQRFVQETEIRHAVNDVYMHSTGRMPAVTPQDREEFRSVDIHHQPLMHSLSNPEHNSIEDPVRTIREDMLRHPQECVRVSWAIVDLVQPNDAGAPRERESFGDHILPVIFHKKEGATEVSSYIVDTNPSTAVPQENLHAGLRAEMETILGDRPLLMLAHLQDHAGNSCGAWTATIGCMMVGTVAGLSRAAIDDSPSGLDVEGSLIDSINHWSNSEPEKLQALIATVRIMMLEAVDAGLTDDALYMSDGETSSQSSSGRDTSRLSPNGSASGGTSLHRWALSDTVDMPGQYEPHWISERTGLDAKPSSGSIDVDSSKGRLDESRYPSAVNQ